LFLAVMLWKIYVRLPTFQFMEKISSSLSQKTRCLLACLFACVRASVCLSLVAVMLGTILRHAAELVACDIADAISSPEP
jgi:hypothetical protein